ncbi:T9SS type A sorting domain-containing protein [Dyadobacter chenwenxiniae]|uniref:T9SS type A sorting domain-containing protein n=1 Tax=Dyadobacter chenwenxiniae TaxID=2906456 RepID=A0A9X1PJ43_9BACT|nr:sialate O-acetylesterase [Dyadobacter chenwenxiniae]MCF0061681.1 T9SS type A sorting domain-containing protein [Dyadobacter chenwenxiniae]UON81502.1 T9SS type A sorting domain-containing protein [Dyadobacter chenwenxiniae]
MTEIVPKHCVGLFKSSLAVLGWIYAAFLLTFALSANAQITLTAPSNNQIIQRDLNGSASVAISVYAFQPYASIEGRLVPISGNINKEQVWNFDEEQLRQGFLSASISVKTGWYRLKITAVMPNGNIDSVSVARVGVGEVLLVAGNSNAMGLPGLGAKSASNDVISFNAVNKVLNPENITVSPDEPMGKPTFDVLGEDNFIFPSGETAWYWGELGDLLSKRLKTPVLFMNAAWAAANSDSYRDAASGKDAFNPYVGKFWPNRQPYSNIVNTIRHMNSWLGLRAVLWSHGENDAQLKFTEQDYFNNIQTLITKTRADAGYNVPWIIARNSASNIIKEPYLPVINAQIRLSSIKGFNNFPGPNLDTIQIPRPVSEHFENVPGGIQGLTLAASAWNRALTDSLFKQITPIQPANSIHTGIVPSTAFPGASFHIGYRIFGKNEEGLSLRAELFDESGKFVDTVGVGSENPLLIKLPDNLANGQYSIRLAGTSPNLAGSTSSLFFVNNAYRSVQVVNTIKAVKENQSVDLTWLVAPNPGMRRMVLEKTTNGDTYTDLQQYNVSDNGISSGVYAYTDADIDAKIIFYRIRLEYTDGTTSYSPIVTVLEPGALPQLVAFPNPVTKQAFYLECDKNKPAPQLSLFDVAGRAHPLFVSDREIIGLLAVRPHYPLPAGIYILRIVTESSTSTQRMFYVD